MQIKLYHNASENNQLSKNIDLVNTLTGTFRHESGIVRPHVLIEAASIGNVNYAYIPEFHRYYYIEEIDTVRNGIWSLHLVVDPLMSFKFDIENMQVILVETETVGVDNYLADDRVWVTKVKDKTSIIQFPSGLLDNGEYILITAGGGA